MITREQIEHLTLLEIFRWILFVALMVCVPYQLLMGLLALCGWHTVSWNGQPVTGLLGLMIAPLLGAFVAVIVSAAIGTGCWAARRVFGGMNVLDDDEPEQADPSEPTDASSPLDDASP